MGDYCAAGAGAAGALGLSAGVLGLVAGALGAPGGSLSPEVRQSSWGGSLGSVLL